jgi:uncharacterized protein
MQRKRRWRKVVYFLSGLVLAYGSGCYYLASKYVRPRITNATPPPAGFTDSTSPNAWISESTKPGKPVFILAHGYGGSQSGMAEIGEELAKRGYGVIIPSMPGHDNRLEETCGFGTKESKIILDAARWIREKDGDDTKIVLAGVSMGGAACWLAAAQDPKIHAVATEAAFARLEPATNSWFNRKFPGSRTYLAPVVWFAKSMSGVDPATVNPVDAAAKWKGKRALIIHGDQDNLFPVENGKELADACGAQLWIVQGAGHAHCSDLDFRGYVDRLAKLAD